MKSITIKIRDAARVRVKELIAQEQEMIGKIERCTYPKGRERLNAKLDSIQDMKKVNEDLLYGRSFIL